MKIVLTDAQTVTQGDLSLDGLREFGEVIVHPLTAYEQQYRHGILPRA